MKGNEIHDNNQQAVICSSSFEFIELLKYLCLPTSCGSLSPNCVKKYEDFFLFDPYLVNFDNETVE